MKVKEALFSGSSTRDSEKPRQRLPEFAFIGRSNVGKSSLINMLTGQRKLAMTSSKPGKTRLVNHFLINRQWYLVDLPGYGFANVSQTEKQKIARIIRDYINLSPELVMLFVLIDSRHEIGQVDMDFLFELGEGQIPFAIVFTKGDKMGPMALAEKIESHKAQILEHWEELPPVFVTSSETGLGKEELLDYIGEVLESIKDNSNN
ncbi:MAG: YihA family ribosome biogenesis GTP-binding protein [Bacteroidales bacterium]|nr:YihA family ribosome biogenesis GTP-binding protein [Bacteroidales bacterium]